MGSIEITGSEKLPALATTLNFLGKSYGLRKSLIFDFFYRCLIFLNILESYPDISESLDSIQRTGCGKLIFFMRLHCFKKIIEFFIELHSQI